MQVALICGPKIENSIGNLDKKLKSLDPSGIDFSKNVRLLIFNDAKKYFNRIKHEEAFIGEIIKNLEVEKNVLKNDNITLEIEINKLNDIIKNLNDELEKGNLFKDRLYENAKRLKQESEEKYKIYINNLVEPLEKKLYDIKQIIIVKEQSILALEIIMRNNKEIISNIDRIKNVTITALNTAVIVAKSLYNQRIVLNKIKAVKNETGNVIQGTGNILKSQGIENYKLATNTDTIESLRNAFNNVFKTIGEVESKNKESFPQNELQIIELKNKEETL